MNFYNNILNILSILGFFVGGFASSYIISYYFYHKGYKKDLDELTKDLNQQFAKHKKDLNKVYDTSKKSLLKMYKNKLVHQLNNDIAKIFDVKLGAMANAMDNADEKYCKIYKAINEQSENILNDILFKTI